MPGTEGEDEEEGDAEPGNGAWDPELEDWDTPDSVPAGPQPGFELVGHRLLQLLVAAPPVLARNELNRLIAGMTVAAPPALNDEITAGPGGGLVGQPGETTNRETP